MNAAAPSAEAQKARENFERVLGEVLLFISAIPPYDNLFLSQITTRIIPPLVLKQFQITRSKEGLIMGYTSWAMVPPVLADKLTNDAGATDSLSREDWNSGGEKVTIDAIGMTEEMMRQMGG